MNWNFECSPKNVALEDGSLDANLIKEITKVVPDHATWVVQEKIEGIGLGISYNDEDEIRFCVRSKEYKDLPVTFHLAEKAVIKVEDKIKKLFGCSGAKKRMTIYGKIVSSSDCDDNFYAFALIIDDVVQEVYKYVGLFDDCEILFSQMLLIAPLDKCLDPLPEEGFVSVNNGESIDEVLIQPNSPLYSEDGWKIILKKQR
jgi:hypothetical protein